MAVSHRLPPPPRASIDPTTPGMRRFDTHTGANKPVTLDNQGHYVYAPTIYFILAVCFITLLIAALFLKQAQASLR